MELSNSELLEQLNGQNNIGGHLHLRHKKRGEPPTDWTYTGFNVVVTKISDIWTIAGTLNLQEFSLTYDKAKHWLKITVYVNGGIKIWDHDANFKSKVESDSASLIVKWIGHIEATKGDHYNIMNDSIIVAKL